MMAEGHREAARSVIDGGEHDATIGSGGPTQARLRLRHALPSSLPHTPDTDARHPQHLA
jgi:hypothetical protein